MAPHLSSGATVLARLATFVFLSTLAAASFQPLSEIDKAAAKDLFVVAKDGLGSPEETYQALRSLQVVGGSQNIGVETCQFVSETLRSSSNDKKQVFYTLKIAEILHCHLGADEVKVTLSNILSHLKDANSLLDFYFAIGALTTIKRESWIAENELILEDALSIFDDVKALGQNDGTWRYSALDGESSAKAAGLALETLARVIQLAGSTIDTVKINQLKGVASKLFDLIESYDDGSLYFDAKEVDMTSGGGGPLAASACVVRGITSLAEVVSGKLKIQPEKFVGLAGFFLSIGVPGSPVEAFYQLDALGDLESNRFVVPTLLSIQKSVLSLTANDSLEASITTVLGSAIPATVTLVSAKKAESKRGSSLSNQDLKFVADRFIHQLDLQAYQLDIGKYDLTFEVKPADIDRYSVGGPIKTHVTVTGVVTLGVEVQVLDSDTGSPEFVKKLNPSTKETVALFANHLQKFQLSLDVVSPFGERFRPHQVFMKFRHETKVEHLFLVKSSGKSVELHLDLLGLVEKLYYLSGAYTMELIVGDVAMENPLSWTLGSIELDLPEPPAGATKPSLVAVDIHSKYGPKPEITHIFRHPEKRPPPQLSNAFFIFTLLPLLGLFLGFYTIGANVKNFPCSGLPMVAALAFHGCLAAVLGLYFLFWLKLNIFTTLKYLSIISMFLIISGHHILSYMADSSSKVKTA